MLFPFLTGLFIPLSCLMLLSTVSEAVDVIGPVGPIWAIVGQEVTLPCRLIPPMNAKEMTVTYKTAGASSTVRFYRNGTDGGRRPKGQYEGRTEMIRKDLDHGTVALKIHNVTCSDAGQYTCSFTSDTAPMNSSAVFELKVAGSSACDLGNELANVTRERDIILKERDNLRSKKVTLTREKDNLTTERDSLQQDRDILIKERDNLERKNYDLINERDVLQKFKDFLPKDAEWRQVRTFADHLILDPDTAHPRLILSDDHRSVRRSYEPQGLLDIPERYDTYSCILGLERFTSGRHYWEVEVGGVLWYVGVMDETVSRKGQITHSPKTGYWVVGVWYGDGYWAFTSPKTPLPYRVLPKTVGVFLDYEDGRISFYDLDERLEIFTFPRHSFNQTFRPYFCTWLTNPPLRLLSVMN